VLASAVGLEQAGSQGYQSDHMGKIFSEGFSFSGFERDKLYLGDGGAGFIDISGLSGLDSVTDGRGAVYADFDNDGDYDVFLSALQGQVHHLFRNNVGSKKGFIRVALQGTGSGPDAYGAEVRLKTSRGVLTKIKAGGSGYVSQGDPRLLFGLGDEGEAEWLEVRWPAGGRQRFATIAAGSSVRLVEGNAQLEYVDESRFELPDPAAGEAVFLQALKRGRGEVFPPLKMVDAAGRESDFQTYRRADRAYLINLWATYCVPCRQEMPELQKLYGDLREAGVDLIGISLDMGGERRKVPGFLARMGITYPTFTTDETVFPQVFSGEEIFIPLSFIVDGEGRIEEVLTGWSAAAEARIRSLIEAGDGDE
jgi:thiol-disulfide isomerase/thioredoxin